MTHLQPRLNFLLPATPWRDRLASAVAVILISYVFYSAVILYFEVAMSGGMIPQ